MFRLDLVLFLVVLAISVAGKLVPEGSDVLPAFKAVFVVAFVMFAAALLRSVYYGQNGLGNARRGASRTT